MKPSPKRSPFYITPKTVLQFGLVSWIVGAGGVFLYEIIPGDFHIFPFSLVSDIVFFLSVMGLVTLLYCLFRKRLSWHLIPGIFLLLPPIVGGLLLINLRLYGRGPSADGIANGDAKRAHNAALEYFEEHPDCQANLNLLKAYGFTQSPEVVVKIKDSDRETFSLEASHEEGNQIYRIDAQGRITKEEK